MIDIKIDKSSTSRIDEIDLSNLVFGKEFSDHMFIADFDGKRWKDFRIQPYGPIPLSPSLSCMHYGQAIFEGLKAYRTEKGINLFRPLDNCMRMQESAKRMCMEPVPEEVFVEGIKTLCRIDEKWIPSKAGTALYIRPFLIASDDFMGIRPSSSYMFIIYCCVVGAYYTEPLKIKIETTFSRACIGGVGEAKAAGNYASALYATRMAQNEGFHQVLWTDATEHRYIEELGNSNFFIVSGKKILTPDTHGTVLKGITRDSIIKLAKKLGYDVEERPITVDEIIDMSNKGVLDEAFATGTAATVISIKELSYKGKSINMASKDYPVAEYLKKQLENIRCSKSEDVFGWNYKLELAQSAY